MNKGLLEKIKRVGETVGEKYFAEFSYSYFDDVVEMIFYDGAYVNTVTININVFEKNTIAYCVTVVFNALLDEEYCETRKISDEEEKVVYALLNTVIFDDGFWIDFKRGFINVYVMDDEEMTEIDLKDIELIKLIEEDIDNDLYIEFKDNYDCEKYIITGSEGYAWVEKEDLNEIDEDFDECCGACDVKEMNNYIEYLEEQLKKLKEENRNLKEVLESNKKNRKKSKFLI